MTHNEKKAREILHEFQNLTVSWFKGDSPKLEERRFKMIKIVCESLSEAERRGFERAKRMAVELCESLGNTSYSKETRVQIFENLKYEEA